MENGVYHAHPVVVSSVNDLFDVLCDPEAPIPLWVAKATIKDEVYPVSKSASSKGRYFYVCDLDVNLVGRMLMLPLLAYLNEQPKTTGIVVQINAGSSAWEELYNHLTQFGEDRVFDADDKTMDMRHRAFQRAYALLMYNLAQKVGYAEKYALAVMRYAIMLSRYVLLMRGDFYLVTGGLCSGRIDTIFVNCIVQALRMIYVYRQLGNELPFYRAVAMANTGDDNVTNVLRGVKFDGVLYSEYCAPLGYAVTSGSKGEMVPFKNIQEVDYLKRSFRVAEGRVWAALQMQSIWKSLAYCSGVPPEMEESRNRNTAISAVREAFLHGRERYGEMVSLLTEQGFNHLPSFERLLFEYEMNDFQTWTNSLPAFPDHSMIEALIEKQDGRYEHYVPVSPVSEQYDEPCSERILFVTEINDNQSLKVTNQVNPVVDMGVLSGTMTTTIPRAVEDLRRTAPMVGLKEFLARPRQVATFSGATGTSIGGFSTWKVGEVAALLASWNLFRGDLRIEVRLAGSSKAMGLLRVWALPQVEMEDRYSQVRWVRCALGDSNYSTKHQLPHLDLDVSVVSSYVLNLPYPHPAKFMTMAMDDWTVCCEPVNAIIDAAGGIAPTVTVQVFASYHNVELEGVVQQSGEYKPGTLSTALGYASKVASYLPFDWAAPASMALKVGQDLAMSLGFSRPAIEATAAMVTFGVQNPSLMSGQPDLSYTLGTDPSVMKDVTGALIPLKADGDTNLRAISRRWGLVVAGYTLEDSLIVWPLQHHAYVDTLITYHELTPLAFVASMFDFYSGSVDVCVEIIGSPLVRWRIGIVVCTATEAIPVTFPTEGYQTQVVDVAGSVCTEVNVPYTITTPFAKTAMSSVAGFYPTLVIFSLTDPVGPAATPVFPYINIYFRAGDDMCFASPTLRVVEPFTVVQQSGPFSVATFGEVVEDVNYLAKRKSFMYSCTSAGVENFTKIPIQPTAPFDTNTQLSGLTTTTSDWCFASYIGMAYWGVSGSYSYITYPRNTIPNTYEVTRMRGSSGHTRLTPAGTLGSGYPTGQGYTISDIHYGLLAVRFPETTALNFRYASNIAGGASSDIELMAFTSLIASTSGTNPNMLLSCGGGDDLHFGGFLSGPILTSRT
jgi:hypothetical protein